jgi:hypothetical protein
MEFQDLFSENKKELVRKFSSKWNREEPSNPLALSLAVVAQGSEDPAELRESFRSLYQNSDGDGLVLVKCRCEGSLVADEITERMQSSI